MSESARSGRSKWLLAGGLVVLIMFLTNTDVAHVHMGGSSLWWIILIVIAVYCVNSGRCRCGWGGFGDDLDDDDVDGDDVDKEDLDDKEEE
jgi:hypothetical protein